jgi:hypothetical protein
VLTLLAGAPSASVPALQVQYTSFEPSFLVAVAQPEKGAGTGKKVDAAESHALSSAVLVLIGNLLPTQTVLVEAEEDASV